MGHSLLPINGRRLLVFGGSGESGTYLNDVLVLERDADEASTDDGAAGAAGGGNEQVRQVRASTRKKRGSKKRRGGKKAKSVRVTSPARPGSTARTTERADKDEV